MRQSGRRPEWGASRDKETKWNHGEKVGKDSRLATRAPCSEGAKIRIVLGGSTGAQARKSLRPGATLLCSSRASAVNL
jgi:hypothetical protein